MTVHLIDGTYELFRHFYGQRSFNEGKDKPSGTVVGVLNGVLQMIEEGAIHVGVAHFLSCGFGLEGQIGPGKRGSVGRYLAYQRAIANFRFLNVSKNTIANSLVPTNDHFYLCNQVVVTF